MDRIRPAKLRLAENLRFAFRLLGKRYPAVPGLDPLTSEWWTHFENAERVRDRLMHPRKTEDLDLRPQEVLTALKAHDGFKMEVRKFKT